MGDNTNISGPLDGKLISLGQPYEVRDWCTRFKCTETELRAAVAAVGNSARAVEVYFQNKRR